MSCKRYASSNVRNSHQNGDKNLVEELNQQIQVQRTTICDQAITITKLQNALKSRGSSGSNNGNTNTGDLGRMKAELQEMENKVVHLKKEKEEAEARIAEMKEKADEAEATIVGQKTRIEDLEEQLRQAKGTASPSYDLRLAENQKSVTFMNLSESPAFDPTEKRQSDLDDINKILDRIGLRVQVANTCRFSPTFLTSDRPPFLKVCFESVEDKQKVLSAVKAHLPRIRSLGPKFAEVAIGDPAKAKAADNNSGSRSPTDVTNNFGSLSQPFGTRAPAAVTNNFGSLSPALSSLSPTTVSNNFGSLSSTFGTRCSPTVTTNSDSLSPTTGTRSPTAATNNFGSISSNFGTRSRLQQMFASPMKPQKHAVLYTDGPGIYTSDDEN